MNRFSISITANNSSRLLFILFATITSSSLYAQYPTPPLPIAITANWTLEQNQASSAFATSVASAGDVNGDGYDDVIVGAPFFDNGQTDEGVALVYYGSAAGLIASPAWSAQSNQAGAQFGKSVASAGDINNDGYGDIIIGAPYYDNGETDEGRVYVYFGSAAGLGGSPWIGEVNYAGSHFGYAVDEAGDVNGDGYNDIMVGAPRYVDIDYGAEIGIVYLYFGSATGLPVSPNQSITEYDGESWYGAALSAAGDVNGDGYDDIIIGALYDAWDAPGAAFAYYGSASGINIVMAWHAVWGPEEDYLGTAVTSGDFNGDGFSDVAVSAPGWAGATDNDVFIYYGSTTGLSTTVNWAIDGEVDWTGYGNSLSTGDFNNDGYSDIIIGVPFFTHGQSNEGVIYVYSGSATGVPGSTAWVAESNQVNAHFGSSVSGAGDLNGDGFDDFIAGTPDYDNGQTDEGQARVYLGNPGCITPPVVTLDFTDNVCHDDGLITLTQGTPSGGTYTGTGIAGTDQFDPSIAGIGTHTITYTYVAPGGCSASASDALTVSANPSANTTLGGASLNLCVNDPVVLVANTGTGLTYQWFKNGVALPGEIYLAYLAYSTGNYQVQTTNTEGCSKMSKKKKVTHTGCRMEGEIAEDLFSIYPNPNNGQFNFQFQSSELINSNVDVMIVDMSGRIIHQASFQSLDGMVVGNFNIDLPAGIYILKLVQDRINQLQSFIVN